jgi:hypothetical protein
MTIAFYGLAVIIAVVVTLILNGQGQNFLSSVIAGAGIGAIASYCVLQGGYFLTRFAQRNYRKPH